MSKHELEDSQQRVADRLDRVVDRLDRLADRFDRVIDVQEVHTDLLREIRHMTQAGNQDTQALLDAVAQLDDAVVQGASDATSRFDQLNATIASLTSLNDQERQTLLSATSAVQGSFAKVTQAFSVFKQDPSTPVDPTPVPDPSPVDPGPVSPVDPGTDPNAGGGVVDPGTDPSAPVDPSAGGTTVDPSIDPGPGPVGPDAGGDSLSFGR